MVSGRQPTAALSAALAAMAMTVACRPAASPAPLDSSMVSAVPAGTVALAGVDLDRLRGSLLYNRLPPSARAVIATYHDAARLLVASNGRTILVIARGAFREPPAGAVLAAPGLALFGPPGDASAAMAQHATGRTGVPALAGFAASVAGSNPIWIVVQGGVTLPLAGNAINLNRLLSHLEFAGITIRLDSGAALRLSVLGRTVDDARRFEETLRGMLSLASAAEARRPEVAKLLDGIAVERDGRGATAAVTIPAATLDQLIQRLPEP